MGPEYLELVAPTTGRQVETDVLLCSLTPPVRTHTDTGHPLSQQAPAQPCPLGVWGHQLGADKALQGGQPPWAASGSETAHSCPRDENGKGGHLARPVSCGVSPAQSPGLGPRPLPIPKGTKGLGLSWMGHCQAGVQEPGPPLPMVCLSGLTEVVSREGQVLGSWRRGEKMGPWAEGAEQAPSHTDVRMYVCVYAGVGSADRAWRHRQKQAGGLPPPQPHAPRMNQGPLPPGAPPPPPPSLVPKYFPPSRSSWDRKIPRATGPALPATARPPSLSLTLCLMGLDSPQRLPGPGREPAANLGCPAKCRLTTGPPSITPVPAQRP